MRPKFPARPSAAAPSPDRQRRARATSASLSDVRSSVRAAFWDLEEVAPPSPSTRKVGGSGFADDPRKIMESLSACTETTPPRAKIVGKSPSAHDTVITQCLTYFL